MSAELTELSEALADVARRRLPAFLAEGVVLFYDHEGPQLSVSDAVAAHVGRLAEFALCRSIGSGAVGTVFFTVCARVVAPGLCRLQLQFSDTGQGLEALHLRELQQQAVDYPLVAGRALPIDSIPRARALCRALDGHLWIDSLPGEGTVVRIELLLNCEFNDVDTPDAGGAKAWLVGRPPIVYEGLTKRLHRLGWQIRLLSSVDDAFAFFNSDNRRAAPALILGSSMFGVQLEALQRLHEAASPTARLVYGMPQGETIAALGAAHGTEVGVAPFGAARLASWTRHVASAAEAERSRLPMRATRPRLLVADDNELNQLLLSEMLKVLGYEVDVVPDGAAAVDHCTRTAPDGVLMDVQMPVLDGLAATLQLRSLQAQGVLQHFPIIAATALTGSADREACFRAGMDGYLSKPLDLATLSRELAQHLPRGKPSLPEQRRA